MQELHSGEEGKGGGQQWPERGSSLPFWICEVEGPQTTFITPETERKSAHAYTRPHTLTIM